MILILILIHHQIPQRKHHHHHHNDFQTGFLSDRGTPVYKISLHQVPLPFRPRHQQSSILRVSLEVSQLSMVIITIRKLNLNRQIIIGSISIKALLNVVVTTKVGKPWRRNG